MRTKLPAHKRRTTATRERERAIQNGIDAIGSESWLNINDTFDHRRELADDEAVNRARQLLNLLITRKRLRNWKQKEADIEILCANLLANKSKVLVTRKPLAISRNRNDYVQSRYTKASYFILELVNEMINGGWIFESGFYHSEREGRMTRIWPTQQLNNFFMPFDSIDFKPLELVILRDKNKNQIPYKDIPDTIQIREILRTANIVNRKAIIQIKTPKGFTRLNTDLYAVFSNGSFDEGGRLYTGKGGYQLLEKKERGQIWINHQKTVELDFSGMQPRLLYAREGIQYPHDADPYLAVIGEHQELRPFTKQLLLALLNADSLNKAISSGNYALHLDHDLYKTLQMIGTRTAQLIERFRQAHPDIAKYFGTSMGLKLMRLDARIALEIVGDFTSKNIPILAIHDSFIVEESRKTELKKTMQVAFSKHNNGFTCPIKEEKHS